MKSQHFSEVLVSWQQKHGRQSLPWQNTGDPYKTWLSEIMLQQTQVSTVIAYYQRFVTEFPTVQDLALAPLERVMTHWQGLGYYSRAKNLHECAKQVVERFDGLFPATVSELESLPGIGRSTAGAVMSLGHGLSAPILDGNVKRVFCRVWAIEGYPEQSAIKRRLWDLAERLLPKQSSNAGPYNQALMDLGAQVCLPRNPKCGLCPIKSDCLALRQGVTHLLPTPKPKKERVNWYFVALLLRDQQNRYLVAPQPDRGLWRGLWMPPVLKLPDSEMNRAHLESWLSEFGFNLDFLGFEAQSWLVHDLTHRKMHFKCIQVTVQKHKALPTGFEFAAPEDKPFPRVFRKLIDHVGSNEHSDAESARFLLS